MTYAMCFSTVREARTIMKELCREHNDETITVDHKRGLIKQDNDEYYFLSWAEHKKWCLGKTYIMGTDLYMGETILEPNIIKANVNKWYFYHVKCLAEEMKLRRKNNGCS